VHDCGSVARKEQLAKDDATQFGGVGASSVPLGDDTIFE
jgi:hypothetical protein